LLNRNLKKQIMLSIRIPEVVVLLEPISIFPGNDPLNRAPQDLVPVKGVE
jgi:hypothetical protein